MDAKSFEDIGIALARTRRRWVGPSAALCSEQTVFCKNNIQNSIMTTECAQTVAPQHGCMHKPRHVATVRVKRK